MKLVSEHIRPETTEDWLRIRKQYLTGSEIASIFGYNSMQSGNQLLQTKLSNELINPVHNSATRWGKLLEGAVMESLRLDRRWHLHRNVDNDFYYNDEFKLGCTPDGFRKIFSDGPFESVVEAKATDIRKFNLYWRTGNPPNKYLVQTYLQALLCAEFIIVPDIAYLACISCREVPARRAQELNPEWKSPYPVPDASVALYKLQRNTQIDEIIISESKRFWETAQMNKMFRTDTKMAAELQQLIQDNLTYMGVTEGLEWVEDEWKKYGLSEPPKDFNCEEL